MLGTARRTAARYNVLTARPPSTRFPGRSGGGSPIFLSRVTFTSYLLNRATLSATVPQAQWRATGSRRASRLTHREVSVNKVESKIDSTGAAGLRRHA